MFTASDQIQFVEALDLRTTENVYGPTRKDVDDILATLTSRESVNQLPPVGIKEDGTVIYGHRRVEAVQRSNFPSEGIPAHVYPNSISREEELQLAINENETQRKATPYEQMHAYHACIDAGMKAKDACKLFRTASGQPQKDAWGSMMNRIYEACQASEVLDSLFRSNQINYTMAYEIARADESLRAEALDLIKSIKNKKLKGTVETIEGVREALQAALANKKEGAEALEGKDPKEPTKRTGGSTDGGSMKVYLKARDVAHMAFELHKTIKAKVKAQEYEDGPISFESRQELLIFFTKVLQGKAKLDSLLKRG